MTPSSPLASSPGQAIAAQIAGWAPAPVSRSDAMPISPAIALHALLETGAAPRPDEPLPPLWHWVYFLRWPATSTLGPDGHPRAGDFLLPLVDRTRMFAGGRCSFERPLRFEHPAELTSSLRQAEVKSGRTGELLLVTIRSEVSQGGDVCIVEEQDFVYRSGPPTRPASMDGPSRTGTPTPAPRPARQTEFVPDPVTLFRFSALTANSHRIHYDEEYAREIEKYPGLLTHGPLLAILMAEQLRMHPSNQGIRSLDYRLHRPVFVHEAVNITVTEGEAQDDIAVVGSNGELRATARASYANVPHTYPNGVAQS